MIWALSGCGGGTIPVPDGAPTHETGGHTGSTSVTGSLEVECALTDALRASCEVHVDPPEVALLRASRSDGTGVRTAQVAAGAASATLDLLAPDTDYDVALVVGERTAATTFRTGSPSERVRSSLRVTGTPSMPYIGGNLPCASEAAMAGVWDAATGELVGYWNLQEPGTVSGINMVRFTPEHTVLGITGTHVVELARDGSELLRMPYPRLLHHDVFRDEVGRTWLLWVDPQLDLQLDGLYVLDAAGDEVGEFFMGDVWPIPGDARGDWAHTNAVVAHDGAAWMSLFEQNAVVEIAGDPTRSDFGELRWVLAGAPTPLGQDFDVDWSRVSGPDGFQRPHQVNVRADGRIGFLDNEGGRALVVSVDPRAGTAVVDEVYPTLDGRCGAQGTAAEVGDGGVLVACSGLRVAEYAAGADEPAWTAELACENGLGVPGGPGAMGVLRWYPLTTW